MSGGTTRGAPGSDTIRTLLAVGGPRKPYARAGATFRGDNRSRSYRRRGAAIAGLERLRRIAVVPGTGRVAVNAEDVRRGWAERSTEYSPGYYAYYGPNETSERVRRTLDRLVGPGAAVLELGCSSGRHLEHLRRHGYSDLHGIDVNDDALDVMAEEYPELAGAGTFHHGAIEDAVPGFENGRYDAVFSVETLQHLHADATGAFAHLARITDDVLVTVECEAPVDGGDDAVGGEPDDGDVAAGRDAGDQAVNYVNGDIPLYYREWGAIFAELGMVEVEVRTLDRDTLRVFRHG